MLYSSSYLLTQCIASPLSTHPDELCCLMTALVFNLVFEHVLYLSTLIGVDYVVIGFDMEVQPLVTHNAA